MPPDVRATYRLQLRAGFGFDDAAALVPYLAELGFSHVYCSPYLQAAPGSAHGYDVADHARIDDALGGVDAFERLCDALAHHGMGQIADVVPNHAAASHANPLWWDVLRHGRASRYARFFDVDWDAARVRGRILLPVLRDHVGRVVAAGEIELVDHGDATAVAYFDRRFPLAPGTLEALGGRARVGRDPALLLELLDRQHYRLAYWRADAEVNYRRFFDVDDLVALRMQEPDAFEHAHSVSLELVARGALDGVRVDHVDGLHDPGAYLRALRERVGDAYVVVEKVLEADEELPRAWPVDGTTGYDFLARATGVLVDPAGAEPIAALYRDFTGDAGDLDALVRARKLMVTEEILGADAERVTDRFLAACERRPEHRDHTRAKLRAAMREVAAQLPVYRTYVAPGGRASGRDAAYLERAVDAARRARPDVDGRVFELLLDVLTGRNHPPEPALVASFQQLTGPVMAKAVEDTAYYDHVAFVALNEVGGDPGCFGTSVDAFHDAAATVAERWPRTMLATSTHDTKRSEDVRARLALLSEIPERWAGAVRRWRALNERHRSGDMPDRAMEYLLYQTLVGAHPLGLERALEYARKAAKEAKRYTSWTDPDAAYDGALETFVRGALGDERFAHDLDAFARGLVEPGWVNSLSQVALKLTAPGVPDVYRGCELWDLSLVDPDNRRPVDYDERRNVLSFVRDATAQAAWERRDTGAPKAFLIHRVLRLRGRRPDPFRGDYEALGATGSGAGHVIAYARGGDVVTIAPRLPLRLGGDWGDTAVELPAGEWTDELTGARASGSAALGDALACFPVAVLARSPS